VGETMTGLATDDLRMRGCASKFLDDNRHSGARRRVPRRSATHYAARATPLREQPVRVAGALQRCPRRAEPDRAFPGPSRPGGPPVRARTQPVGQPARPDRTGAVQKPQDSSAGWPGSNSACGTPLTGPTPCASDPPGIVVVLLGRRGVVGERGVRSDSTKPTTQPSPVRARKRPELPCRTSSPVRQSERRPC